MLTVTLIWTALLLASHTVYCTDGPIVETPQGKIKGTYKLSYHKRTYAAFEGIPYAKPPVGELRFMEPQPTDKWNGIFLAKRTYMCMSFMPVPIIKGVKGTEDCLYLYVYVPKHEINPNDNMDVVVHIHGGAFMLGSPGLVAGPNYIMDKDVVYVSMNYRLGILGFLSTEDDVVSGNNGLKDQSMALRWIKNNIKYFGGNPDSITITGNSAGGASVHYHYLSPMSRGLFHKGFSQSGTALQPWALTEEPLSKAKFVAAEVGCTTDSNKEMVKCLREKSGNEVVLGMSQLFVLIDAIPMTPFGPVVEKGRNGFLVDHPYKLIKEGKVYDVPWVTSNVKEEGILFAGIMMLLNALHKVDKNWDRLAPYILEFNSTVDDSDKNHVAEDIRKYYCQENPITIENVYDLVRILGDRLFVIDAEKAARIQAKNMKSPVYYYFYTYIDDQIFIYPKMRRDVTHTDDAKLLFHVTPSPHVLSKNDEAMMKLFVNFIAHYAKTGIPKFGKIDWIPVVPGAEEINYLEIASPKNITMKSTKELTSSKKFWMSLPIKENDKLF